MASKLTKQLEQLLRSVQSGQARTEKRNNPKSNKPKPGSRRARRATRNPRDEFGTRFGSGMGAPAAVSSAWGLGKASFAAPRLPGGCMRIKHSEFLANVNGATTFTPLSVSLNPGLSATFPWLAALANNFESYIFHDLSVVYRTMKGTSTNGEISLAIDYDAADGLPLNKTAMFSNEGVVKAAPWENVKYQSSKTNLVKSKTYYTRSGPVAGTDIKTYDVGNLIYAADACADTSIIGDLFLEYDVEFMTPQQAASSSQVDVASQKIVSNASVTDVLIFGTAPVSTGSQIATPSSNTLTFNQAGEYLVTIGLVGSGLGGPSLSGTATYTAGTPATSMGSGTTGIWQFIVQSAGNGQTFTMNYSSSGTVTDTTVRIALYDTNLQ